MRLSGRLISLESGLFLGILFSWYGGGGLRLMGLLVQGKGNRDEGRKERRANERKGGKEKKGKEEEGKKGSEYST